MTPDAAAPHSAADPTPQEKQSKAEPSGPKGDNPATAGPGGPGQVPVQSDTPENRLGHLNPSGPADTGTTPGTNMEK